MMQQSSRRQGGATIITILLLIAVVGTFLAVAFKLGPHYMQFMTVKSVMDDVKHDPESKGLGRAQLLSSIDKGLYINEVRSRKKEDFDYKKVSGGSEISVDYEVRQPLIGNLEGLMTFSHTIKIEN